MLVLRCPALPCPALPWCALRSGAGAEDESLEGTLSEGGSEASGSASLQGTQSQTQTDPAGGVVPVRKPAAVLPVWLEDASHNEFVVRQAPNPKPGQEQSRYVRKPWLQRGLAVMLCYRPAMIQWQLYTC